MLLLPLLIARVSKGCAVRKVDGWWLGPRWLGARFGDEASCGDCYGGAGFVVLCCCGLGWCGPTRSTNQPYIGGRILGLKEKRGKVKRCRFAQLSLP